jgi:hypothetical protein
LVAEVGETGRNVHQNEQGKNRQDEMADGEASNGSLCWGDRGGRERSARGPKDRKCSGGRQLGVEAGGARKLWRRKQGQAWVEIGRDDALKGG